jgi:predicted MFS family arabinose efflux permease
MLVLAKNLDEHYLKTAVVAMSTTTSIGTFIAYGLGSLLAVWNGFKYSFLVAFIAMVAVACLWVFGHDKVTDYSKGGVQVKKQDGAQTVVFESKKSWLIALIKCVALFGAFAVIINFIKDGLSTWVPKVLKDEYKLGDSLSILLTLCLPVFGVLGTMIATNLSKKIKEFSTILGLLFLFAGVGLGVVVGLFNTSLWIVVLVFFATVYMFMAGANATLTTTIPLYYRDKFNSGLTSGLINGCCYIGSALSSIIIGVIADACGGNWLPVFYVLLGLCTIPLLLSLGCAVFRKRTSKKGVME